MTCATIAGNMPKETSTMLYKVDNKTHKWEQNKGMALLAQTVPLGGSKIGIWGKTSTDNCSLI